MKKTIILTLAVLLLGAYQEAQAYKITISYPEQYDSCYITLADSMLTKCANLYEMELVAGDTVWIEAQSQIDKNCKERYGGMFFKPYGGMGFSGCYHIDLDSTLRVDVGEPGAIESIIIGKYASAYKYNETPEEYNGWYYFVPNENLKQDISIIKEYTPDYVKSTWIFNNEHVTVFDERYETTTSIPEGSTEYVKNYDVLVQKQPIKITPKEGYEITSISIDTAKYSRADGQYIEHVKYTKGDVSSDNDWIVINEDGSVNVMLTGHVEIDGILHSKNWLDMDDWMYAGSRVKVETGITGIDETAINSKKISPNPATSSATLTLNLESAGNLRITLNDLLGKELFEIHNEFTDSGNFTRTFSTANLVKGIYYLKIFNNGGFITEKLVIH